MKSAHHGLARPSTGDSRLHQPFHTPRPLKRENATVHVGLPNKKEEKEPSIDELSQIASEYMMSNPIDDDPELTMSEEVASQSEESEDDEQRYREHTADVIREQGLETAKAWFNLEAMKFKRPRVSKKESKPSKKTSK